MKLKIMLIVYLLLLWSQAEAFNCGNGKLATSGMHKYQIIKDCGAPTFQQVVGYYPFREEWVYITEQYGKRQMFLLKINSTGKVYDIIWLGEVK